MGILVDNAMQLVFRAMPRPRAEDIEANLLRGLSAAAEAGLTAVHDAGLEPEVLEVYRKLASEDRLPVRVYAMLDGQKKLATLDGQMELWKRTPEVGLLTVRAVKLFADGALGSRGAKMFEPYEDDPATSGLWVTPPEELRARIARVAAAGYQPCVHAIGDRACAETLQAFAAVPGARRLRPRVEHLQLLRPQDAPLLRESGAVASMQPTHATSDAPWAEARIGRGTERQRAPTPGGRHWPPVRPSPSVPISRSSRSIPALGSRARCCAGRKARASRGWRGSGSRSRRRCARSRGAPRSPRTRRPAGESFARVSTPT